MIKLEYIRDLDVATDNGATPQDMSRRERLVRVGDFLHVIAHAMICRSRRFGSAPGRHSAVPRPKRPPIQPFFKESAAKDKATATENGE